MNAVKYGVSYELNLISYDQNIIDNYIKMENSPVGDAPETLVEQIIGWVNEHIINPIVNAAITIGGFIYHGLVVIGNFIKQAIDVVKEFLMELWDTTVENVKRAVEVVKRVVKKVCAVAQEILKGAMKRVLQPLIDAYVAYRDALSEAGLRLIRDYERSGKLNISDVMELNRAIMKPFFYGILGLGMAIWGAITLIQGLTVGVVTFIGPLVGIAVTMILTEIFRDSEHRKGVELPHVGLELGAIRDAISNILNSKKVERFMVNLVESLLSTIGFLLSLPSVSEAAADLTGTSASLYSYVVGVISLIFSFGAVAMELADHGAALMVGSLAVALSMESVALGAYSLLKSFKLTTNQVLAAIGLSLIHI